MEATTTTQAEGYIKTLVEVLSRRMAFATKNRYNYGLNSVPTSASFPSPLSKTYTGLIFNAPELVNSAARENKNSQVGFEREKPFHLIPAISCSFMGVSEI
ncbi:hypothetical protein TNCV_3245171 [Trichonephila clavipes]|nr:hypothetical protein TNCV_3245171 [Trichonephila clavipes]